MPERPIYTYLGDKNTSAEFKNKNCTAIYTTKGTCIRGRNGAMLVQFGDKKVVVVGRRLRKQQGKL
ncbi:MAG: hypothetical protein EOO03_13660 [Chitinophagaceae bacterium]|nr:MAG: hypothetical protein EOO03_13660 [Chitinophagaceae bacterium]